MNLAPINLHPKPGKRPNKVWSFAQFTLNSLSIIIALNTSFPALGDGVPAKPNRKDLSVEGFDIKTPPSQATWQYFLRLGHPQQMDLWNTYGNQGIQLGDWAWQWRLAWVRACESQFRGQCAGIMEQALQDKAMVVRSAAAASLGNIFDAAQHQDTIDSLVAAFNNPANSRGGKPLMVQFRILYSLWMIGGKYSLETGEALAQKHLHTATYWKKLTKLNVTDPKS